MENYPPNSRKASEAAMPSEKKVERVTSGTATLRKKPLSKKFTDTFFGADLKSVAQYVLSDVLAPAAKDMIVEAGSQGLERFIFGDSRRGSRGPTPTGHIAYNRMSQPRTPTRPGLGQRNRARHNFDDVVLQSRSEGQEVLSRMYDILSRYESVTVADLYELVGLRSDHTDLKWGWTDLHGASVDRLRAGGFLLDLPAPEPIG